MNLVRSRSIGARRECFKIRALPPPGYYLYILLHDELKDFHCLLVMKCCVCQEVKLSHEMLLPWVIDNDGFPYHPYRCNHKLCICIGVRGCFCKVHVLMKTSVRLLLRLHVLNVVLNIRNMKGNIYRDDTGKFQDASSSMGQEFFLVLLLSSRYLKVSYQAV